MNRQIGGSKLLPGTPEAVIPFAPHTKAQSSVDADQLDVVGQNVLALLHRAADMSDQDYSRLVETAHKLSDQLEDAKERIKELEADLEHYRYRTDRAEQWLSQIAAHIEQRFFSKPDNGQTQAPPAGPRKR